MIKHRCVQINYETNTKDTKLTMARLPSIGGDNGQWGVILNDFLSVELNADGTLKKAGDIVTAQNTANAKYTKPGSGIPEVDLDASVQAKLNGAGASDATTSTKGVVRLAGDLAGTAANPTVPGLAAKADTSAVLLKTNNLSDLNNFATARQNLGLTIGTHVQAWDADLDTWSTKVAPSGAVVGATDTQVLTNKTLTSPAITSPTGIVKADVGLGNVDNTSDASKPVSAAAQTALNTKEDVANKSTTTSLGTSNTLYPSQNAVKTYVDTAVSGVPLTNYVLKAGDTMTGSLAISNNGNRTTLALTNTTAGVGLTIGGDTNLYRAGADILKTDDQFNVTTGFSNLSGTFGSMVNTATYTLASDDGNGLYMLALQNYAVYNSSVNKTIGGSFIGGIFAQTTVSGTGGTPIKSFDSSIQVTGGATISLARGLHVRAPSVTSGTITTNAGIYIDNQKPTNVTTGYGIYFNGTGTTGFDINWNGDTNLYRLTTATLKTDSALQVGGNLSTNQATAATSGVTTVNAPPISLTGNVWNTNTATSTTTGYTITQSSGAFSGTPPSALQSSGTLSFAPQATGTGPSFNAYRFMGQNGQIYVQNSNDNSYGGFFSSFSSVQFVIQNSGGSALGIIPGGSTYAFFGIENTGKVGSIVPGTGVGNSVTYRNLLDDGSGKTVWSTDTNLYRSAADTLKTDDNLIVAAAGTVANSVATIDATQTLTNKRITARVTSTASSATPTPNATTDDVYLLTALAAAATFAAPTGTPTDGQSLIIRIKDNGTARALTWNAIYRAVGTALPTTTVISKTLYLGFKYNLADTKWDCLAVSQEA